MATLKERVDQHDREIAAIRRLILEGMRLVGEERRLAFDTRNVVKALAEQQKKTEQNLNALIESLRRGGNGHVNQKPLM